MRLPTALLLAASLLLTGPGASAQIGLPSVRLPDPTQTLPPLPSIGAEPLATVDDMLAGLRLDRIATLLRQNPDRVELDERGEPAVPAVLIASGLHDPIVSRAAGEGFLLVHREHLHGLGLDLARLRGPTRRRPRRPRKPRGKMLPDPTGA